MKRQFSVFGSQFSVARQLPAALSSTGNGQLTTDNRLSDAGLTLVELIITVAIVAILASAAVPLA